MLPRSSCRSLMSFVQEDSEKRIQELLARVCVLATSFIIVLAGSNTRFHCMLTKVLFAEDGPERPEELQSANHVQARAKTIREDGRGVRCSTSLPSFSIASHRHDAGHPKTRLHVTVPCPRFSQATFRTKTQSYVALADVACLSHIGSAGAHGCCPRR